MNRITERVAWGIAGALGIAVVALLSGVVAAGPLTPPGPPAATQETLIFQPTGCAGFPITISTPGSYKLGSNITGCAGATGINITGANVTLDLNGFTVSGVPGSTVGINATFASGGSISNGVIASWGSDGLRMGSDMTASGLTVRGNAQRGILGGTSALIRDNHVSGNGLAGIYLGGTNSLVEENVVTGNSASGGGIDSGGIVAHSGGANGLIQNNTVSDTRSAKPGIVLSSGFDARVVGNLSTANQGAGILVSTASENVIENNTVSFNGVVSMGGPGIHVTSSGRNNITNNEAIANNATAFGGVGGGFWIPAGSNTIAENYARANTPSNYVINALNDFGPIGTAAASTSPWANISD